MGVLDQFDEDTATTSRVNEGNEAMHAPARFTVNELDACCCEGPELVADVIYRDSNVVQRLAVTLEESGDATFGIEWPNELELRIADGKEGDLDALIRHLGPDARPQTPDPPIALQSLVHVWHHNRGVVDSQQIHGRLSRSRRTSSANPASIDDSAPWFSDAILLPMPSLHLPVEGSYRAARASLRP